MFVVTDDGTRLHVIADAAGEVPLVLSNSLGTELALWDGQAAAFSLDCPLWRYDTRGHGHSDAPAGEYSLERLGKDLLAVIDASSAPRVDVCGVSIGGLTALWAAVHAPARIRRLILANTAARIGDVNLWSDRIRSAHADGMRPLADAAMQRWFTQEYREGRPEVVTRFRSAFEATNVAGYVGCCAALRDADLRSQAARVGCPTLVVTGRHDRATPPEDGRWLASQIRGAHVVELDAAHLSNVERAEEFNAAVRKFLAVAEPRTAVEERHG